MKIRKLKKGESLKDLVELSYIMITDYEVHHKEFFHVKKNMNKNVLKKLFIKSLEDKDMQTFVAEEKERIIGFITIELRKRLSFMKVERAGFIPALVVSPKHRRKGIADKLLEEAIKWFKKTGQYLEYDRKK